MVAAPTTGHLPPVPSGSDLGCRPHSQVTKSPWTWDLGCSLPPVTRSSHSGLNAQGLTLQDRRREGPRQCSGVLFPAPLPALHGSLPLASKQKPQKRYVPQPGRHCLNLPPGLPRIVHLLPLPELRVRAQAQAGKRAGPCSRPAHGRMGATPCGLSLFLTASCCGPLHVPSQAPDFRAWQEPPVGPWHRGCPHVGCQGSSDWTTWKLCAAASESGAPSP